MKALKTRTKSTPDEANEKRRRKPTAATGLKIAEFLAQHPHGRRLVDIATEIGMDRAQTHRMITAMVNDGWVIAVGNDGTYSLAARTICMGSTFISRLDLSEHARPFLDDLAHRTGESVFLGELRRDAVVCVGRRVADHSLRVWTGMGDSWPIESTAVGAAVLAGRYREMGATEDAKDLPEAVQVAIKDGYARDFGRYRDGIEAIAAPIQNSAGEVIGAIAVSGPSMRMDEDRIADIGTMVRESARGISERMGYHNTEA